MATTSTPQWAPQHAGVLGQADAMAGSAAVNQFLGTHPGNTIYQGSRILTPNGTGGAFSSFPLNAYDKSQPFTLSGTSIGRVAVPFVAFGTGADLIVSLCNDNSGTPGTVITRTRIPASWFQYLSKYTAITGTSPVQLQATNSPLATAANNAFTMGAVETFSFSGGTPSGGGFGSGSPAVVSTSTTIVMLGGLNGAGTWVTNTATIPYGGGNSLENMVPQAPLPIGLGTASAAAVTTDPSSGDQYVVITGGQTGGSGSYSTVSSVYASQLSAAGNLSTWSTQASLPTALLTHTCVAYQNTVYVIGGVNGSNQVQNAVYWGTITNGQLQTWNTGPPLPVGQYNGYAAAINGFLVVAGGYTAPGNTGATSNVWWAPINSDGSLGSWQTGPSLPVATASTLEYFPAPPDGLIVRGGLVAEGVFSLPVSTTGPGIVWQQESYGGVNTGTVMPSGSGQYFWFEGFAGSSTSYTSAGLILCPYVSVPLPATGLTNGGTYHLMFQQPAGAVDLNNYLSNVYDENTFPGNPLQMIRPRGSTGAWTTQNSGIPFTIYDNSNGSASANGATGNNTVWHTWDDQGARIGTLVRATTPEQRLLGICEATASPTALNSNTGFQSGVSPWTGVNGTIAQSSAQSYEGGVSLLLTPNGGSGSAYAASEFILCTPGVSYTVTGWCMSPGGYASVIANLVYYNASFAAQSGSSSSFNAAAGVWTPFTTTFAAPTAACVYVQIHIGQQSTPGAGNLIYFDQVMVFETYGGPQVSTVAQVEYAGTWPGTGLWPPTGVTVLS